MKKEYLEQDAFEFVLSRPDDLRYMMTHRFYTDVLHFLEHKIENRLWCLSASEQADKMRILYNSLPDDPKWFRRKKMERYYKKLKKISQGF